MRKVVVYAGTRNVYHNMTVAAKSLLCHTRMDRVWFLIEDDEFPEKLPAVIKTKNMSGQQWFPDGPNTRKRWSYMSMLRLALPEILPEEDRVLWLDIDTIVNTDITDLFETELDGCYVAAVEEPIRSKDPFLYYNAGVMVMDLKKLRDGMADLLIRYVNRVDLRFPDQDVINLLCQGRIKPISPYWNSNIWIVEVSDPGITHFAADRKYEQQPLWQQYEQMEWRVQNAGKD